MLTNPTINKQLNYTNKQLGKNGKYIHVQPTNAFTSECSVQRDICLRSMANHPCDPVCPLIYWSTIAKEDNSNYFKSIFLSGLGDDHETKRIVEGFFYAQDTKNTQKHHPSIICMEWLEGYQTFKQHWNKKTGVDFSTLSNELAYQMMRLLSCGYVHTDLNIENIMYRPDTEGWKDGGKEAGKGKIQLIDFGRVRRTKPVPIEEAFAHVTRQQIFETNAMPFPDEEIVRDMIQHRCAQKKITNVQLLDYGITYQKEITTYGYDHTSVSSVLAFLKHTYYELL
jgi:serine/threonine protein kinase